VIRFAAPAALWLLAILPLIILLYMLRSRRAPMPVSSVLLWQRTRHELATQLPIRRLERSLLLLLQLLAITAAILALAQPAVRLAAATGQDTVIVVDLSASMQATDVPPTRYEAARRRVVDLVRLTRGPFMIISAGARPRIEASWGDRESAISALSRLRPTDGPAALDQAIGLALAQRPAGRSTRPRVVVLTDGALTQPLQQSSEVQFIIAGMRSQNVGIVRLYTEVAPAGTHVVTHIRNTGTQTLEVPLTISVGRRRAISRRIILPPGATSVSTALLRGEGTIKAEIAVRDALALDNIAYGFAGGARPRVLVVGAPDRALDEALAAVEARRVRTSRITPEALERADVIILNATPPVPLPPGNYLLIGTTALNLPVTAEGMVRNPTISRWSRGHRVLRYVDLDAVQVAETLNLRPTGGEVLADGEVPLIWAFTGHGIRAVVLGFTLGQTDLALHPAFPILLSNALDWLTGSASAIEAGQAVTVSAGRGREARLTDPGGSVRTITARNGAFSLPAFDRAGIYSLGVGAERRQFAVNVPAAETDIAPKLLLATSPSGTTQTGSDRMIAIWPLITGAALALLVIEWFLWLRTLPKALSRRAKPTGRVARVIGA
jgi:Ca-activated chloride channel family protein